jgi:ABC-type microcin C transport system duplicated ATPase subunit YejF
MTFDTQIMKIYFNFFHISVDFKLKKGQTTGLVQEPYSGTSEAGGALFSWGPKCLWAPTF